MTTGFKYKLCAILSFVVVALLLIGWAILQFAKPYGRFAMIPMGLGFIIECYVIIISLDLGKDPSRVEAPTRIHKLMVALSKRKGYFTVLAFNPDRTPNGSFCEAFANLLISYKGFQWNTDRSLTAAIMEGKDLPSVEDMAGLPPECYGLLLVTVGRHEAGGVRVRFWFILRDGTVVVERNLRTNVEEFPELADTVMTHLSYFEDKLVPQTA